MLRTAANLRTMTLGVDALSPNFAKLQAVRWNRPRKPRWMPMAKSKMFKIPPRPVLPHDEREELKRLCNNYRTQMKSIRQFLTNKHSILLQASSDTEQLERAFREDLAKCHEINEEWNARVKVTREKRVAEELEHDLEFARNRLVGELQKQEDKLAQAEEEVRRQKEAVGSFVTPEKLEEAIERALNNPVDYNFAVDLEGNRVVGRETRPEVQDVQKLGVKQ